MRSTNLSVKLQADAKKLLQVRAGFHRSIQESGYEHEQVMNTARTRTLEQIYVKKNRRLTRIEEDAESYRSTLERSG